LIVKNPGKGHPSFRLMKREHGKYKTVPHPDLDLINKEWAAGLPLDRARQRVDELRKRLEKAEVKPVSWLPENMAVAEAYIAEEVIPKGNRRPKAAIDRVRWGAKHLGRTDLLTATKADIAAALGHLDAGAQRRAIPVINALLRFKGRAMKLRRPKRQRREIDYLTPEELAQVVEVLPKKEWRLICFAAFATGARYGELFAITSRDLKEQGSHVWLGSQRLKDWSQSPTKNEKVGDAFVIAQYRQALREWILVPVGVKKEMRRKEEPGEWFKGACEKTLSRPLTFHNLRHSYAHYMLAQGAGLEDLKKWMRDRIATIEDYYLSWVQTSSEMQNNKRRFG
jgi:integrase